MSLILAFMLAQLGPSVSPGGGPALPQAPLEIPKQKRAAPAEPQTFLSDCLSLARASPLEAIEIAEAVPPKDGAAAQIDAAECKAWALANLERWDEAAEVLLAARGAIPANERTRRARFDTAAAIAFEELGQNDRALALYRQGHAEAVAGGDKMLAGSIARDSANVLFLLQRSGEAEAALVEAREAIPDDPTTWLISARAARKLGKLADAQSYIQRAAILAPIDPKVGLEAGVIAVLDGREAAARKSWQSVIAAAPESTEAATAKSYLDQLGPDTAPTGR